MLTLQVGSLQPVAEGSVGVKNNDAVPVTLEATTNGFDVRDNELVLGDKVDTSLQSLISVTPATFTLGPGESVNVQVSVRDDSTLRPGGHYVSLLIRQASGPASQVAISSAVSATMYIIKEDGAVRSIEATDTEIKRSLFALPNYADIRYKNTGNVTAIPRGVVQLKKGGNVIAQGVINAESVPIFSDQSSKLRTELGAIPRQLIPGKYTLSVDYRYDGEDDAKHAEITFWYIPAWYLFFIAIVIAFLVWASRPQRRHAMKRRLGRKMPQRRKDKRNAKLAKSNPVKKITDNSSEQ